MASFSILLCCTCQRVLASLPDASVTHQTAFPSSVIESPPPPSNPTNRLASPPLDDDGWSFLFFFSFCCPRIAETFVSCTSSTLVLVPGRCDWRRSSPRSLRLYCACCCLTFCRSGEPLLHQPRHPFLFPSESGCRCPPGFSGFVTTQKMVMIVITCTDSNSTRNI